VSEFESHPRQSDSCERRLCRDLAWGARKPCDIAIGCCGRAGGRGSRGVSENRQWRRARYATVSPEHGVSSGTDSARCGEWTAGADGPNSVARAEGQLIPLTLDFATAGEIRTKARVIAPIGSGSAAEVGLFGLGDICIAGPGEPGSKRPTMAGRL